MKRRATDLESRLVEWGREYGGGKYEDTGWQGASPLLTMMTYHGRAPQGLNPRNRKDRTPADDVHDAVQALGRQRGGWNASCVIRAEYMLPGQPVIAKLQKLRAAGVSVSDKSRYSQLLREARIHVAAWLRIAFDGDRDAA